MTWHAFDYWGPALVITTLSVGYIRGFRRMT